MKIGIEYEGVIMKDGKPIRWPDIPEKSRVAICTRTFDKCPVDSYDCLAEIRFLSPAVESRVILDRLMGEISAYNKAFLIEGYYIVWGEVEIPKDVHGKIVAGKEKDKFKITKTITSLGVRNWNPTAGNTFRGGGVHINVSPISQLLAPAFALELHEHISSHSDKSMKSNYRHHILFRTRKILGEDVTEYMTFGLSVPNCKTTDEAFEMIKHNFHWADVVVNAVKRFS